MCMVVRLTLRTKTKNTLMNETVALSSKCYNYGTTKKTPISTLFHKYRVLEMLKDHNYKKCPNTISLKYVTLFKFSTHTIH